MNYENEINELRQRLAALEDIFAKYKRSIDDTLNNLDIDNLSSELRRAIYPEM